MSLAAAVTISLGIIVVVSVRVFEKITEHRLNYWRARAVEAAAKRVVLDEQLRILRGEPRSDG